MSPDGCRGPRPVLQGLVANRGEIAIGPAGSQAACPSRCTPVRLGSLHVETADESVLLEEGLDQTYLNGSAIIEAARSGGGRDPPGYGFLSRGRTSPGGSSPRASAAVRPPAIETMGDKISARLMIESRGPRHTRGRDPDERGGPPGCPGQRRCQGATRSDQGRRRGGEGHEVRLRPEEPQRVRGRGQEASAAFGDGTVYIERLLTRAGHVEIGSLRATAVPSTSTRGTAHSAQVPEGDRGGALAGS